MGACEPLLYPLSVSMFSKNDTIILQKGRVPFSLCYLKLWGASKVIRQWFMMFFCIMMQHTWESYAWNTEKWTSNYFLFIFIASLSSVGNISISEQKSQKLRTSYQWPSCGAPLWESLISPVSHPCEGVEQTITVLSVFGRPGAGTQVLWQCSHMRVTTQKEALCPQHHKLDLRLERKSSRLKVW